MKHVKTIALGAVVALAVGATTATADTLITGGKIKNGTVAMRDLTPGVQALIKKRPINVINGATRATGEKGAAGKNGVNGTNGRDGVNGRDGTAWQRGVGSCSDTANGKLAVVDGVLTMTLPEHNSYAQFKLPVGNLSLNEISKLSFKVNQPTVDGFYAKLKLEGGGFLVIQPGAQGEQKVGSMVKYDVTTGVVKYSSDASGTTGHSLADAKALFGDLTVTSFEITGGCAAKVIDGPVQIDDVTLNSAVIDFN